MANISFYTRMTVDLLIEQKKFFARDTPWGFEIMMILALYLIGFAFSGLTRSSLIEPKSIVWPGLLSTTALTGVLHSHRGPEISGFANPLYHMHWPLLTFYTEPGSSPALLSSALSFPYPSVGIGSLTFYSQP